MKIKSFAVIVATCSILSHWDAFGCSEGVFMKQIYLGGKHGSIIGNYALVDDDDYEWLSRWKWHVWQSKDCVTKYAIRTDVENGRKEVKMHRQILGLTDPKIHCDHDDGDGLNNQRHNIRACTWAQNMANRRKPHGDRSSIYKGVVFNKETQKWMARININKTQIYLGLHESESGAALAYNEAAIMHHKEFALLNEINI
jgi:hypothetical protein